jgi:ADP-ribose pyrophosphatase YjhB (NUDIX family)
MNYCSQCGQVVVFRVPPEDKLPRFICETCGTIHYQNPRMVVGSVAEWEGTILLCRRAIEPRRGYWTLPAGFMENHETLEGCARREAEEEALAEVELGSPVALINVPHASQVHLFFRARLVGGRFGVGHESLDAALYAEPDIPWNELAFPSVEFALRHYFSDRAEGRDGIHVTTLERMRREAR